MTSSAWFVAETLPRSEARAELQLRRQDFTCFLPRFRKTRSHARRVEHVLAPVFPGYIFVSFDPDRDPWRSVNGTLGVRRLVGPDNGRPLAMPAAAMAALLARCEGNLMVSQFDSLAAGRKVKVLSGPLADRIATIEECDDKGRVHILLNLLGGPSMVQVPLACLGPA